MDRPPPTSRVTIIAITAKRVDIYRYVTPSGDPIPVGDINFLVDDAIPEDKYIYWAVHRLILNRSGGPSGIQAEHLI